MERTCGEGEEAEEEYGDAIYDCWWRLVGLVLSRGGLFELEPWSP